MSENTGSSRKRKAISATLTVAMAVTMLLSGTLAYYYSANATNVISNTMKEVVGHDDLFKVSDTEYNKDVYAENTGTKRVFVRIRLSESFSLDGSELVPASAGVIHTVEKPVGETEYVAKHIVKNGGTNAYDPYTGAGATALDDHFSWELGGTGKYFLSKASKEYPTSTNSPYYIKDNVAHDDRNNKTFTAADAAADPKRVVEAPDCQIMTMAEYTALDQSGTGGTDDRLNYTGWVIDTDGWAYWSQPVEPGAATGLLLNKVTLKKPKDLGNADYEYKIKVDYQAVDDDDMGIWLDEKDTDTEGNNKNNVEHATTEAQAMLRHIRDNSGTALYDRETMQLINEVNAAIDNLPAGHDATISLYNNVLIWAQRANLNVGPARELWYNRAVWAKGLAEQLEVNIAADPTLLTDEYPAFNQVTDPAVRKAILNTWGKDGKLTKAQAFAVTNLEVTGAASLAGLSEANFPNFFRIDLYDPEMGTINLGSDFPNLKDFIVVERDPKAAKVKKIDFGSAKSSIEAMIIRTPKLEAWNATNAIEVTGTPNWRWFEYVGPTPDTFDMSQATALEKFLLNVTTFNAAGDYVSDDASTLFDANGLTLNSPALQHFELYRGFTAVATKAEIDLSACPNLKYLIVQQKAGVAVNCKVSDQAPLTRKNNSADVTIQTVP